MYGADSIVVVCLMFRSKVSIFAALCWLLFALPAMSDTVPYLFSHNKSSFPDARFISATEVLELRRNENKLEFYLNSFDNNAWTAQPVATVECSNCSSASWHANNNMIALTSRSVGPGIQSRVWLIGRQDSGDWNSIEIENTGQTGYYDVRIELLDNRAAVYLRSDFDSDTSTRAFLLNPNNGWSELALENLPAYFVDERNTAFLNYTNPSGTWLNFVVYSEGNGDVEYHTTDDGVRQIINIAPPGAEPQDSIQNAEVFENTLLINAATQDGDYPNQGAVHFYGRANNTWRYEFTVWKITTDRSNASLLSESVALIGNRIFERQFDQTWVQTAGINSDGGIRTIFLEGNTIGWRDDLFFQLASWGPAPGCENIGPSGLGNFQQSACTLEEQPQTTPIDGLSTTLASGSFEPFTSTPTNESLRFVSVEMDGIELYEFDESERNLTKRVFSACERIAPQSTDCFHTDGFVDGNTIVATSYGPFPNRHRLFFITIDDQSTDDEAVWQELSIPDSELSSNGTFVDGLALEDSLAVFSASGPGLPLYVISESQSGQWMISASVSTAELKIRSRLDTSIDNGRIAITSGSPDTDDKVQLFRVSATGDLFYETTIKPANIPSTNYKSLDLHGDALLVGGTLFYASFLEQFTDLASGTARLFERDESGAWEETGQFQSSNAQERSYGQQVFLSDGFAVVMASARGGVRIDTGY